jgi:O-antigen ligase
MNRLLFSKIIHTCLPVVYAAFFLSIFCGIRVMSSTCEGVILGFTLLLALIDKGHFIKSRKLNYFVIGCIIFYFLQLLALLYTNDISVGIVQIEVKITLLFIPVSLYYSHYLNEKFRNQVMPYYVLLMALVMLFCFGEAALKYGVSHDKSVFFYYSLVAPLDHHAIQFSIFAFVGFIYLMERLRKRSFFVNKFFHFFIISYFIFFIILLDSKMVIIFCFISILIYIGLSIKKTGFLRGRLILFSILCISILATLFITNNPVSNRFRDLSNGVNVIETNQFNPGDYFNGIQFRLLQWKLVKEILGEHSAWIAGVSPGDAQHLLDKKYKSLNMYVGDEVRKSHGYLGYNTHNEFLESTLQNGLIGLFVFLVICAGFIQMMVNNHNIEFWLIGTLILSYCFLESVFQTQYGVLLFTFFPMFLYCCNRKDLNTEPPNSGVN